VLRGHPHAARGFDPVFTFVTDGIQGALAKAQAVCAAQVGPPVHDDHGHLPKPPFVPGTLPDLVRTTNQFRNVL
jgi:hypothetical protein